MYRSKDFIFMDVQNENGSKMGIINDVLLNFNLNRVYGFNINTSSFLSKSINITTSDIISFSDIMIIKPNKVEGMISFKDIKNMDVIDTMGNILGVVEEILFQENNFEIKGLLVSTGIINNVLYGKRIVNSNQIIVGDENILIYKDINKIKLFSRPHKILMDVDKNEKVN